MLSTFKDSADRYFLQNGKYPDLFEDLDVSLGPSMAQDTQIITKNFKYTMKGTYLAAESLPAATKYLLQWQTDGYTAYGNTDACKNTYTCLPRSDKYKYICDSLGNSGELCGPAYILTR